MVLSLWLSNRADHTGNILCLAECGHWAVRRAGVITHFTTETSETDIRYQIPICIRVLQPF